MSRNGECLLDMGGKYSSSAEQRNYYLGLVSLAGNTLSQQEKYLYQMQDAQTLSSALHN